MNNGIQRGGKLQNKVFVMMAAVSIVPIVIAAALSVWSITASHRLDVATLENALIYQKSAEIRNFVNAVSDLSLTTYVEEGGFDISSQQFLLKSILATTPALEEVAFLSLDGMETARFSRTSPEGVPKTGLRNESKTEKFLALAEGRDYVGSVYFTLKGPMVTTASFARNKEGKAIAFLSGEVNLSALQEIMREARLGESGYLYVVDEDGFVIAGGFKEQPASLNFLGVPMVNEILKGKNFLEPEDQQRYSNFAGEEVVASGAFLERSRWGIITEWPVEEADAILNKLLSRNLIVICLVVIAVILLSVLLASLIVRPIKTLEERTKLVAQGKFDEPVAIRTGDEIEELGTAFNKMVAGLKQLQQLKDEFVFIAAHELRTPVAAIKGYLSLVLEGIAGPVSDEVREFIEKVMSANKRLIQLVDDLLQVARSEAGRLTVKVAPIDIAPPIHAVISELKPLADEKAITMAYSPPAALPKVMADADRVKEIMVNLVGNAIKYTFGSGTVTISHDIREAELVTQVKDTGIGMSKEDQKKLFEKFYRIQNEKTRDVSGTGLGLFIVKQLAEKMGGTIWAFSEGEGKGSTFSFSLPIAG